ncbi:hypothetical protein PtA15_3A448 [Puccinia triticina]|uniref:Uncharacterized protein n=1 Tax=Puccinia triticina TaxID=208348 RepID=A0ABY7CG10_9BASI|nr:uncharacterized protein PtA15_3A448 [Puccinia triticina]WAQ83081.1 hypothetical protein PtA15_3A448 [Puccinia triticina]
MCRDSLDDGKKTQCYLRNTWRNITTLATGTGSLIGIDWQGRRREPRSVSGTKVSGTKVGLGNQGQSQEPRSVSGTKASTGKQGYGRETRPQT